MNQTYAKSNILPNMVKLTQETNINKNIEAFLAFSGISLGHEISLKIQI